MGKKNEKEGVERQNFDYYQPISTHSSFAIIKNGYVHHPYNIQHNTYHIGHMMSKNISSK